MLENCAKRRRKLEQRRFINNLTRCFAAGRREAGDVRFCSAIGTWVLSAFTTCAHIIPKSLDSKELAYVFGVGDAAVGDFRNGIIMDNTVKSVFDKGWITIVSGWLHQF